MRDQAFAEEGRDAAARAVEELVGDDEIERAMLFLERADGAEGDDALHAERFHAVDIGAEVQFRRRDAVTAPVAREKRHLLAGERAEDIVVRRHRRMAFRSTLPAALRSRASSTARCLR